MKMKRNSGITLVALIITVIVLLIISGVVIGELNDSYLIVNSQYAALKYKNEETIENDILGEYGNRIAEYTPTTPEINQSGFYYNESYTYLGLEQAQGQDRDTKVTVVIDEDNNITQTIWADWVNVIDGTGTMIATVLDDGFGESLKVAPGSNENFVLARADFEVNRKYEAYNSLGLLAQLWFDSNGDYNMTYTIPGTYVTVNGELKTINLPGGITATFSNDGKSFVLFGKTFAVNF